ncbi:MAG: hypothetical protein ABFD89_04860 [Bryobacteraceae bacterium]
MRLKLHPVILLLIAVCVCAGVFGGIYWYRSHSDPGELLSYFPRGEAVVLSVDAGALRRVGVLDMLAGSNVAEEPEYKAFVGKTGFNYRDDVDRILVSFQRESTYYLITGRFDWKKIRAYAIDQGGECRHSSCRMPGSVPTRNISFFPLRSGIMALAVSTSPWAAGNLTSRNPGQPAFRPPSDPVWLFVPASRLRDASRLPAGTRLFAKAMEPAEQLTLSLAARQGNFEALLDVTCRSTEDASLLSLQMQGVTELLRKLLARANQKPSPGDFSGVLAEGTFRHEEKRVIGRWPLRREFLESLAGGTL